MPGGASGDGLAFAKGALRISNQKPAGASGTFGIAGGPARPRDAGVDRQQLCVDISMISRLQA